jgi:serine/threonine-protein kinase RsbW
LPPFALTLDHGLSDLAELRTKLAQWLLDAGVSAESSASLVLAAHEATANAAQHSNAETPVEANAWLTGPDVVIEVKDHGRWKHEVFDDEERGRGLFLISALLQNVEIRSNADGTTVRMQHPQTLN